MNIIKRLTAVTSLTVCVGILAPTTIVLAKTNSTNDSHMIKKNPELTSDAVGFSLLDPAGQTDTNDNNSIFGNSLLQQGDTGPSVVELQDALHALGYYSGNIDGIFDTLTSDAARSFQSDQKIADNGIVGAATKTALYDVYRNTEEAKAFQKKAEEIKKQDQKAEEEKAKKAAEEKAQKARAEKARKAAEIVARLKQARENQHPVVKAVVYKPESRKSSVVRSQSSRSLTVVATSYALGGRTATGIDFSGNPDAKVIAVDPDVIPLGSRVLIPGYGIYLAADTGGSIQGNRIDIHFPSKTAALNFGVRTLTIQILH
ncbi:peptidoglycan-binding protein [Sporolactobacillus shoreae]|uniref:Peptidoglycan-binding protein n=1 Tax=Sporolactobacillus shoreae TaxID=1465501 RepID=A0A4Z0GJZ3_9BACL|nr:3D domain-containing protein [Sporolactobacillus shoreae]TGA97151.1 peptidoglycan-binding protein [Sporolactobacillus shoreae]